MNIVVGIEPCASTIELPTLMIGVGSVLHQGSDGGVDTVTLCSSRCNLDVTIPRILKRNAHKGQSLCHISCYFPP